AIREALEAAWANGDWGRYEGSNCNGLREALAAHHGVKHAHLCSSGTFAVELALRAIGVGPGDGVVLAGYDFPGNFRAIEAIGAVPVLVDVAPLTWSLDVEALEALASEADAFRIRAVVVSHLHGGFADMRRLRRLADDRGWSIVEDACQAMGATLHGRAAGVWGDVGVLSFGGSKLLTAGRGGALLTDSDALSQRCRVLAGRGNDAYPLSELQAAVLLPQLATLGPRHEQRRAAVDRLLATAAAYAPRLKPVRLTDGASPAFYKLAIRVETSDDTDAAATTSTVLASLAAEGVPVGEGFRGFVSRSGRRCQRLGSLSESGSCAERTVLIDQRILLAGDLAADQVGAALKKVARAFPM
ncbi:MAG: aminotransferase class I/II-fold pyridoxal phosphate-dependent enzyme, partial [Planctomycetota bacterium]